MLGSKFLSETILTPNRFKYGCINAVEAWVGSGKTYFTFEHLQSFVPRGKYILYITDTCMNREQILATFKMAKSYNKNWREFVNNHPRPYYQHPWGTFISEYDKIVIMNYAQVGAIIHYGHPFDWSNFEFIVCDELHNLVNYRKIKPDKTPKGINANLHDITINKINDTLINHTSVRIIGLSATPSNLWQAFNHVEYVLTEQELNDLKRYTVVNEWDYRDSVKVIRGIPQGSRGIIYFDRINAIQKVESMLQECGHSTGSFWSTKNQDHLMTPSQLDIRENIISNHLVPQEIDILLINAACQTGVNIKNEDMDFMIVHSSDADIITQVRGRLRHDLNTLYTYNPNKIDCPCPVPVEYLNVPLTPMETKAVCDAVRLMKPPPKNECYKWGKVKDYLSQNGYSVYQRGRSMNWHIEKL